MSSLQHHCSYYAQVVPGTGLTVSEDVLVTGQVFCQRVFIIFNCSILNLCRPTRRLSQPDPAAAAHAVVRPVEEDHLLEGLPELVVEEGVDDGVEGRVDVPQPRGEEEEGHGGHQAVQGQFERERAQHVAREERDPAEEEHA